MGRQTIVSAAPTFHVGLVKLCSSSVTSYTCQAKMDITALNHWTASRQQLQLETPSTLRASENRRMHIPCLSRGVTRSRTCQWGVTTSRPCNASVSGVFVPQTPYQVFSWTPLGGGSRTPEALLCRPQLYTAVAASAMLNSPTVLLRFNCDIEFHIQYWYRIFTDWLLCMPQPRGPVWAPGL